MSRTLLSGALTVGLASAPLAAGDVIASPYDPAWGSVLPSVVTTFDHDGGLTDIQNGANLAAAIEALVPGERLEIGAGTYSINSLFNIDLVGTASAPIWIAAQAGAQPVITRPNAGENVLNVGDPADGIARYVALQGLEITGGSVGIRLLDASEIWIDRCFVHDTGGAGITANTPGPDIDHLYITRNEITATSGGSGEGVRLGGAIGNPVVSESVVALNWIHHTGGAQGDGIELGDRSWGNWIAENTVHDTNYPCVIVYGADNKPVNVIERNVLYRSNDVVLQVQAEADIFSNLIVSGAAGFYSHQLQGETKNIRFEHNTVLNSGRAVSLVNWNDKPGMFFINNICYSESAEAVKFHFGDSGITISKNARFGILAGVTDPSDFIDGNGLPDFENVYWDGSLLNARPTPQSPVIGAGATLIPAAHGAVFDINGQRRDDPPDIGCYEKDSWGCHYGWGEVGPGGQTPSIAVNGKPTLGNQNFTVFLKDGPPGQLAFLPWGFVPLQLPVGDGNVWLFPFEAFFDVSGPQGAVFFNMPIPNAPALDGLDLYFQWVITNPWSPFGWAFSEGLELTFSLF